MGAGAPVGRRRRCRPSGPCCLRSRPELPLTAPVLRKKIFVLIHKLYTEATKVTNETGTKALPPKMLSSTALRPLSPATTPAYSATPSGTTSSSVGWRRAVVVRALRDYGSIPKGEPFSSNRSILDEFFKQEKPLVQRTKDHITDYCTTLEGDECCSCWDAYFELSKLEQELPQGEIARMVKESRSDPRYLISSIHHRSELRKKMADRAHSSVPANSPEQTAKPRPFPVPDGLPKTQEEIDEEEEALMPESSYTRLLRRMGRYPDWYTPRPDHETD